jgi:hypothetical protein
MTSPPSRQGTPAMSGFQLLDEEEGVHLLPGPTREDGRSGGSAAVTAFAVVTTLVLVLPAAIMSASMTKGLQALLPSRFSAVEDLAFTCAHPKYGALPDRTLSAYGFYAVLEPSVEMSLTVGGRALGLSAFMLLTSA